MSSIATIVAAIFGNLRAAIAAAAARDRVSEPLLVQAWAYIGRTTARFERLYARWHAGTLPPPRPARPATAAPPAAPLPARTPAAARLPRRRAWLLRHNNDMGNFGSQLRHLTLWPDMAAFLAAVPRAGRLLRPVLHMLGTELNHTQLDQPAPPRRPRPPRTPRPARKSGKYPRLAPNRYSPGRIPMPILRPT